MGNLNKRMYFNGADISASDSSNNQPEPPTPEPEYGEPNILPNTKVPLFSDDPSGEGVWAQGGVANPNRIWNKYIDTDGFAVIQLGGVEGASGDSGVISMDENKTGELAFKYPNVTYTLSMYFKVLSTDAQHFGTIALSNAPTSGRDTGSNDKVYLDGLERSDLNQSNRNMFYLPADNQWHFLERTFVTDTTKPIVQSFSISGGPFNYGPAPLPGVEIKALKIEEGSRETPWAPGPDGE